MKIEEACARAAHAVNNEFCAKINEPLTPQWSELTDTDRAGRIRNTQHALAGGSPEDSHALWMESRLAEGWTLGPVKDFAKKTSPNLVPYHELPEMQRRKDALFQTTVRAMAFALRGT